mgnify:CR=1 FL=1
MVVVLVSAILFLLRPLIAELFVLTGVAQTIVFLFAGPLSLLFFFNGVIFVSNAAFNNLGHPYYSTAINWARNTLGIVPFVLVGSAWFGAPGVLVGQFLGGTVFAVIAWLLARRVMAAPHPSDPAEPFQRQSGSRLPSHKL